MRKYAAFPRFAAPAIFLPTFRLPARFVARGE